MQARRTLNIEIAASELIHGLDKRTDQKKETRRIKAGAPRGTSIFVLFLVNERFSKAQRNSDGRTSGKAD
jgi:hypothetical protein